MCVGKWAKGWSVCKRIQEHFFCWKSTWTTDAHRPTSFGCICLGSRWWWSLLCSLKSGTLNMQGPNVPSTVGGTRSLSRGVWSHLLSSWAYPELVWKLYNSQYIQFIFLLQIPVQNWCCVENSSLAFREDELLWMNPKHLHSHGNHLKRGQEKQTVCLVAVIFSRVSLKGSLAYDAISVWGLMEG